MTTQSAWQLVQLFFYLIVFAVLGRLALVWYGKNRLGAWGGRRMVLVETLPLGPNRLLCLVRVHDRFLLLGVSEQTVNVLREFDRIPEPEQDRESYVTIFSQLLKRGKS
ncbi:MAG: flagellar biosynthetic protein FliO [Bacillota bacterium]